MQLYSLIVTILWLLLCPAGIAAVQVFYPLQNECSVLFNSFSIAQPGVSPARINRFDRDRSARVDQAEQYVHAYYKKLMKSGKHALFNEQAFAEFIREDKTLPKDRTVFLEYTNPVSGEVEGVMRIFVGFPAKDYWRVQPMMGRKNIAVPQSDPRLPMQYNQFKPPADFFNPVKLEFGRLVTREGVDRIRIATEMMHGAFESVLRNMPKTHPQPTIYVHTDRVRTRLYERFGFKTLEVDRQGTNLRDGEYVMAADVNTVYERLRGGLDRAKREYDLVDSTGDLSGAIALTRDAIKAHPASNFFAIGHRHLAELLMDQGNFPEGRLHAETAYQANPTDASTIGTFLKALRLDLGFYTPKFKPKNSEERLAGIAEWQATVSSMRESLAKHDDRTWELIPQGMDQAYLSPFAIIAEQQMAFAFAEGDLPKALGYRRQFLKMIGDANTVLHLRAVSLVNPAKPSVSPFPRRLSPKFTILNEPTPGERVKFRVLSDRPNIDYMFLQMRASKIPGLAATREYHEACAQLADLVGDRALAGFHRQFSASF